MKIDSHIHISLVVFKIYVIIDDAIYLIPYCDIIIL